jgi:transposase/ribosomal protein L30/L7E
MEAYEIARLFVNKTLISKEVRRRGNPGYPRLQAIRLLVYARLKGIGTDKGLIRHLERNRRVVRGLRLNRVPHRTTVGRWWRHYKDLLREVFEKLAQLLQHPLPCSLLVVDSTPLEDGRDPEARWGYTSRGPFLGFKLHVSVNQEGLPLRALVTPGNRHDSPFLPRLIQGLRPERVVADAGYDSKENREAVKRAGAVAVIPVNPRRRGRQGFRSRFSRGRQYLVEQFNSLVKDQILKGCWRRVKGLGKKAGQVYAGLIGLLALSLKAVINGEPSLRRVSQCWS